MFESFFPHPKLFLLSAILSAAVAIIVWYGFGTEIGRAFGFALDTDPNNPIVGVG